MFYNCFNNKKVCVFFAFLFLNHVLISVLMKCFNGFCKEGVVHAETVSEILAMMGLKVQKEALDAIIAEVDEDGKCI